MPSSYSSILRLELPADGEQAGTWGSTVNRNLGTLIEQAIAGNATVTLIDADVTLTTVSGGSDEARAAILSVVGAATQTRSVIIPGLTKVYVVSNFTSGGQAITVRTASGTGITINNNVTAQVYCDGVEVYLVSNNEASAGGTVTSITVSAPLTGGTITGTGTIGMSTVSGLTAGTYGAATQVPVITVDVYGRVTYASQVSIGGGTGSGTVSQVNAGAGLTGGPITSSGTLSLATTGVAPSTYGSSTSIPVITVDVYGRLTGVSTTSFSASTSISNTGGSVNTTTSGVTITAGGGGLAVSGSMALSGAMVVSGGTLGLSVSGAVIRGLLWDGSNMFVGRGTPGSAAASNVLYFSGDSSGGNATFTVGTVYKTGGGSFAATSDERLKDIHGAYTKGLADLLALEPITFNYKESPAESFVGLSAQKVSNTSMASMIRTHEDGYLGIDNSELVYTLINAVRELKEELDLIRNLTGV